MNVVLLLALLAPAAVLAADGANLLLNPDFAFHAFDNSRSGATIAWRSGSVPGWSTDAYGDIQAMRGARVPTFRPVRPVGGVVAIQPGKRLWQTVLFAEAGLDLGEVVSLHLFANQPAAGALRANLHLVRVDSAAGEWSPKEFGQPDDRVFPRHSRGELIWSDTVSASADAVGDVELTIDGFPLTGGFTESGDSSTDEPNSLGLAIELVNTSADQTVHVYAPTLARGAAAQTGLPTLRALPDHYRHLPRTMQKLWRGEPLHLIVMGSSIDRGSANPRMMPYDEDPASPTYKQPLGGAETPLASYDFDGELLGKPEWSDYVGWWQHWFMYGGRLRRALMQRFDYPVDKLLLNTMACDGSSISEAHSGFADWASLSLAPDPNLNGHRAGTTWPELYPPLFARREGPRPDLIIFGSGANEKVDGADEVALFEGAIRWFQRRYPGVEFVFCMWQNRESYTPNTGHLAELALRYGIPYIDFATVLSQSTRYVNSYALAPKDGHPQAAAHDLWFQQLERAFFAADPIQAGIPQVQLPERISPYTLGWEGDIRTYAGDDPRVRGGRGFILDDTMVNLWAASADEAVSVKVDGEEHRGSRRRPMRARDPRNSTFATGKLTLGDRHIVEVTGPEAQIAAVDSKAALDRRRLGVDSPAWRLGELAPVAFESQWGAPYGDREVVLPDGATVFLDVPATDLSVAYVDDPAGGTLQVSVDGEARLEQATNVPFTAESGEALFMENRRGILALPYGWHRVEITAAGGPVRLLGLFAYDTRPNRDRERVLRGVAHPGETVTFSEPFAARPLVIVGGQLAVAASDVTPGQVTFAGAGPGGYTVVGE